jgi:hypothetical protein
MARNDETNSSLALTGAVSSFRRRLPRPFYHRITLQPSGRKMQVAGWLIPGYERKDDRIVRGRGIALTYRVFVSHSAEAAELGVIYAMATEGVKRGLDIFIAERADDLAPSVLRRNQEAIHRADCFLLFVTSPKLLDWVHQELGFARGVGGKLILPLFGDPRFHASLGLTDNYFILDWDNPWATVGQVSGFLQSQQTKKEANQALGWLILGGLALILLSSGDRER